MKIKLFIDFDGTLFDRDIFKKRLISLIKKQGFSDTEVEKAYQAVYRNNGYDGVWAHLKYLNDNVRPIDLEKAESEIKVLFSGAKELLFPDAIKFLSEINREKYEVNLITVGGLEFQKQKVNACRIESWFDNCYYTTKEKVEELVELVGDIFFILLEDKDDTIKSVKERFPKALVIKAEKGKLLDNLKLLNSENYALIT